MHPNEREAQILAQLKLSLHDHLEANPAEVTLETRIVEDLGADSLGLVECILDIEERFEVDIPDDDASAFRTVGDVVAWLARSSATVKVAS